jgi:DNA-binding transcriptional MerR regulator
MENILASEYVSIGELVRITNSRYSTLKHYTEEGMLPFEQAEENLTRRYKREETVARILWIKEMKTNGLSIPQMKEALGMN